MIYQIKSQLFQPIDMRYLFLLYCLFLIGNVQAQRNRSNTAINISTAISYNPASKPYTLERTFNYSGDEIELTYITENSGTFIEEDKDYFIEEESTVNLPSNILGISTGVQFIMRSGLFHELTFTTLSYSKARHLIQHTLRDFDDRHITTIERFVEFRNFEIGGRYEVGRYLGRDDSAVRVGISGGVSGKYQRYMFQSSRVFGYPVEGRTSILHLVVAPMMMVKFSDKVFVEFKFLPRMLLAKFDKVSYDAPILLDKDKQFVLDYDPPSVQVGASLMLKYQIQTPRRRRR